LIVVWKKKSDNRRKSL